MARYRTHGPNRWFTFQGVEIYPDGDDGWITPKDTTLLNGATATAAQVEAAMIAAGLVSDDLLRLGQSGRLVSASRTAMADPKGVNDNGATLELASGVTYTLSDAVPLPSGVVLLGPVSGTATIAVTGAATINGATASVSVNAGQVFSAIPRVSNGAAFIVKGS